MPSPSDLLAAIGATLDGLGIALCAFDDQDRTLAWNRTFLEIFPEHREGLHVGEPYRRNLERFYRQRLGPDELPAMERYIDEGIARHRQQRRAYAFEHRGRQLCVSSLPVPGVGRVRIWKTEPAAHARADAGKSFGTDILAAIGASGQDNHSIFDSIADGVMVTSPSGIILWVNDPFVAMYGLRERAVAVGARYAEVYAAAWRADAQEDSDDFLIGQAVLAEGQRYAGAPFEVKLPGERWIRVVDQRSADGSGILTHVDITVLMSQQQKLRDAERRSSEAKRLLEATLDRMEQGIMMVDAGNTVQVCNRRAVELLGLPVELMASKPQFSDVLAFQWAHNEFERSNEDLQEFVRRGGILDKPQLYDRERPNGQILEIHSVPIAGGGVLRTYTDITERRKSEERVRHVSRHDGLTELANREVFLEHLAGASSRCVRSGERFAVLYVDLDRFKPVNDRYGHAVGDQVLRRVAGKMRGLARESDVVARMGGDEFAILQRQVEHGADAHTFALRLLDELGQEMIVEGHAIRIGASIGIAHFPSAGRDPDTLLRSADAAMYVAKANGRDCVRTFVDTQRDEGLRAGA